MALLNVQNLRISFGGDPLLDDASCAIQAGDRIGLLGRNGAGKTTFLRILSGELEPDGGVIRLEPGAQVSILPQHVPQDLSGPTREIVAGGLNEKDEEWEREHKVATTLSRMKLDPEADFARLSAGMKRRVLLARALAAEPDLLLLDEPTNHLDLDAVLWLEQFLGRWNGTLIFVTHDRMFLRRMSRRILEIDRGRLLDWSCDYDSFLTRKESALAAEEQQNALFDKKLTEEEAWIRRGIKARRTRNEGRVRVLEQMRRERAARRAAVGEAKMSIDEGERSGKLVVRAKGLSFSYGKRELLGGFSTAILRGDKLGLIGPNGAGKTTLLRILLGELEPHEGTVQLGSKLQVAYFDQLRRQLDDDATVQENLVQEYDTVGNSGRHIIGYLQDFLFTPERARTPVRYLSGGERNRLLLAKLFARPANVIVLDEPTNDLDIETLELLEQRLVPFEGSVIVVSHDREFLNNVVTSTIAFEEDGPKEYVGGYDDWARQSAGASGSSTATKKTGRENPAEKLVARGASVKPKKMGFKEKRELETLPGTIEQLESQIEALQTLMAKPEFYQLRGNKVAEAKASLTALEAELRAAYSRWLELEG
jgi:ATP-binding cassette subfamily F protein uup